jgi:hypothetical protein
MITEPVKHVFNCFWGNYDLLERGAAQHPTVLVPGAHLVQISTVVICAYRLHRNRIRKVDPMLPSTLSMHKWLVWDVTVYTNYTACDTGAVSIMDRT